MPRRDFALRISAQQCVRMPSRLSEAKSPRHSTVGDAVGARLRQQSQ
jgi:hypothetical protein